MKLRLRAAGIIILSLIFIFNFNLPAQFGKNKVQYRKFDWKYIESRHFDVYFDAGSKRLAKYTAIKAEESLAAIQSLLNYRLRKRIIVVVYNSHNEFQQTNVVTSFMPEGVGGVTEMLKNRVVVPFQGNYSQLEHVIHHELIHAVINCMFYGGSFQSALSTGGVQIPLWMNEGLAEFSSAGGMDVHTDMFMRDLTISENLPPLNRLYGYLAYRGGQTFYWYVAEKYGEQRVGDLLNRLKINRTLNAAFQSAFDEDLEEFSEKWQKYMKKYYWTDLEVFEDPNDFAIAVTDHKKDRNFYNTSPAISPDGEKVAYISDDDGLFGVFIQDIDDKESKKELVSSFRAQDFEDLNLMTPGISWSPDGKFLAISAKAGGEDAIFIVDAEDGDYEKITFGILSISSVVWSPDGKKLAFIGSADAGSDVFIYTFRTEGLLNVTDDVFSDLSPVWAPDSETLYFISDRGNNLNDKNGFNNIKMWDYDANKSDIYSIALGSNNIRRLTFDPEYQKYSIAVSPDGSQLLYVSDKNGIGNIYQMDLASGLSRPKTNSLNGITQISLAPDGSKALFSVEINAGYDIFMIRYPFEKSLDIDELPLTKFRKSQVEKTTRFEEIIAEEDVEDEKIKLQGYGDFELEFDRQEIVKPNPDVSDGGADPGAALGRSASDTSFVVHDYKLKFTPDIITGNPGFSTYWGFQGVTQMLFSDVLGDHQIFLQANLLLDLRNSSLFVAYNYLPDIIDYQLSAQHSVGFVYRYDTDASYATLYRFRNWGAGVFASLPFSMFDRIEWGLKWMNVSKENVDDPSALSVSRMLFVPEGRFVHDDVLYGLWAPVRGTRMYVGFKGVPKFSNDGIGFMTVKSDLRHYIPLGDYLHFAMRGAFGASFGPDPQSFFLGGAENWINHRYKDNELPFDQPEDFAFMEFIMPLRGFAVNEAQGSKFFLTNFELRFPLFRALLAGPIPILFQGVQGALFYDMGGAWDDAFRSTYRDEDNKRRRQDLMMSAGVGVRTYLLGIPVKMDVAWANEFSAWSKPRYLFSLGYDF